MMKRQIEPANDNLDKANTYRDLKKRYKRATEEEFYLEAFLLSGAMIEDRELSFLYYLGIQKSRNGLDFSDIAQEKLFAEFLKDKTKCSMQGIESKTKIIKATLKWVCERKTTPRNPYLKAVKSVCENTDLSDFLNELVQIEKWARYRNEIVHSLYNKNIDSLNEDLRNKVEEGMRLAKYLDCQVRIIKKDNRVRKAAGL